MKNIISALLLLSFLAISNVGNAQSIMDKSLSHAKPELSTIASARVFISEQTQPLSDDCKRYKRMKIAGIGTSVGAGAFFIIGIALIAAGEHNATNGDLNSVGQVQGGGAMLTIGILGLGAGIPLAVIGTRRYGDTCSSATLELHSGSNGSGLALNF